ncbi:MAG: T9SS type A sorting domain-containing protein, partial [Bacteroidota bacterium]|nr:T9SS type A sorting domain-containing protein [Bacteroidota bacterium]
SNGGTTEDIANLIAGTYIITVTDAIGCMMAATYVITEPDAIAITSILTMVSCYKINDGEIDITVTGGTAPYTFMWSNLAATEDVGNLKAGMYSVKIIDANGCVFISDGIVITQPNVLLNDIALLQGINCSGDLNGSIDLSVMGGTMPYSFNWSNGETTEDVSGLGADTYTVVVADANGCLSTGELTIIEPMELNSQMFVSDVSCYGYNDGVGAIVMTGGTYPYAFDWSNGGTDEIITNMIAGQYDILVTDANGCTTSNTAIILEPDPIDVTFIVSGTTNLLILSNVSGGTGPFTYLWDPSGVTASYHKDVTPGDVLTLHITDVNGCTFDTTFTAIATAPTISFGNSNSNQEANEGLSLSEQTESVVVYPNPNTTSVFFISGNDLDNISEIKVYDSNGRIISSNYYISNNGNIKLDLENISKGMYYLRISHNTKGTIIRKLIITK